MQSELSRFFHALNKYSPSRLRLVINKGHLFIGLRQGLHVVIKTG